MINTIPLYNFFVNLVRTSVTLPKIPGGLGPRNCFSCKHNMFIIYQNGKEQAAIVCNKNQHKEVKITDLPSGADLKKAMRHAERCHLFDLKEVTDAEKNVVFNQHMRKSHDNKNNQSVHSRKDNQQDQKKNEKSSKGNVVQLPANSSSVFDREHDFGSTNGITKQGTTSHHKPKKYQPVSQNK